MKKIELIIAIVAAMCVTGMAHSEAFNKAACTTCNGSGETKMYQDCIPCDGGWQRCSNCRGEGQYTCGQCGGRGTVTVYGDVQTCNLCDGDGTEDCGSCHGAGQTECNICGGEGGFTATWTCNVCGGSGQN